jgi:DNA-binding HxlR family transcriptional regulator
MTGLPTSVETYLEEAGFTPTELLILRFLLEGEVLSLRELAAKCGKSTGVLDQAMKKLIRRRIVTKETINDRPKFVISSLDAVTNWMKKDMELKRDQLTRREKDFESFVASLQKDQSRPDMEHFDGLEGLERAYRKLLDLSDGELLQYIPISQKEEDDPLHDFRVQYFRERHKRKIFSRVIIPDTSLGRRFQSRDPFEFRKSVLLPENQFPFSFEKIIAGSTVACFNYNEKCATFIHYPELAEMERGMFEMMCKNGGRAQTKVILSVDQDEILEIPWTTQFLSSIRDLFMSKKGLAALALCGLLAAGITYGMYLYTLSLMKHELGERLMAIAATAAPTIHGDDLKNIRFAKDVETDEYQRIFKSLNDIRDHNDGVMYAYILRPTSEKYIWEFVADADTNYFLPSFIDSDGDKILDEDEENPAPGTQYFLPENSLLRDVGLKHPFYEKDFFSDQWGTFLIAHAPILDSTGNPSAVLGIDMEISNFYKAVENKFIPWIWFIGILVFLVIVRFIQTLLSIRTKAPAT